MSTKNRIRSGARAGKSNTGVSAYSDLPTLCEPPKASPLRITHQELHEKISKEVASALKPLESYKDFLDAKHNLSFVRTEINETESRLSRLRDNEAELERAVTQFAKSIKTEVEEALR